MTQRDIEPASLRAHLAGLGRDGMDIFTLEDDTVRGAILNASGLVNAMRANHQLGILETMALGYGYMAALLCTMQLKGRDRIRLQIDCEGPMKGLSVDADSSGNVRGYLKVDTFPLQEGIESLDLAPWIGEGTLTLTRLPEGASTPVSGTTRLHYGNIAHDLARHFKESEQTHTAFALSIYFDPEGLVKGAGGIFLQAMPGASDTILEDLELWLPQIPRLGKALSEGQTGATYLHDHFGAFSPRLMGVRGAEFSCQCSHESFTSYFLSMEKEKRRELWESGPHPMVVVCHNCATSYSFGQDELDL